jgi:hypothetical protein
MTDFRTKRSIGMQSLKMRAKQKKNFFKMSSAERHAAVKQLDREISFEETKPLSLKAKALWERSRRGRGSPRNGRHTKAVVVAVDESLLERTDQYAEEHGLSRSELIERGLQAILSK